MESTQSLPHNKHLFDLFQSDDARLSGEFQVLLTSLERFPAGFTLCANVVEREFLYVSPSIRTLTGFAHSHFLSKEGWRFFYDRTPAHYVKEIQRQHTNYLLETKQERFNFYAPQLMQFEGAIRRADNQVVLIRLEFVVLSYTEDGMIELILGRATEQTTGLAAAPEQDTIQLRQVLRNLKELYVKLFPQRFERIQQKMAVLQATYYPLDSSFREITNREKEVLVYLGNGLSTKEIACELNISFNTIETHRKRLLEKFEARNSAELIKKASKVFWL